MKRWAMYAATWIVGDYQKMATGGYMDEIERCLHAARR